MKGIKKRGTGRIAVTTKGKTVDRKVILHTLDILHSKALNEDDAVVYLTKSSPTAEYLSIFK